MCRRLLTLFTFFTVAVHMDRPDQTIAGREIISPPEAKRVPRDVTVHGDPRIDDYYWLRERGNPEVIRYLEAENAYARAVLAPTIPLQETLYNEYVSRLQETDSSVPERRDDWFYYTRTEKGKQYEIHCRRHGSLTADEEIILDENLLAGDHNYFSLGAFAVTPDHRYLGYSVDTNGNESHTLFIKDLESGALVDDPIPGTYYGVEWANDNRTLFYTTLDGASRPHRLHRHTLSTPVSQDALVYEEADEAFFVSIRRTKSRRYLILRVGSNTTTEEQFLDADDPQGSFRLIEPRRAETEYYSSHHGDTFFILTNDSAKNFRLMEAPVADPSRANWHEVIPHRNAVKLDDVDVFAEHLVVFERTEGLKKIRVIDLASGDHHYVEFLEPVYTLWAAENPEFETNLLRFNYTSLVTPRSVIDYNMVTREQNVLKRYAVLGGYHPGHYQSERVFATAHDGTRIPISLVYRQDFEKNGSAPLFLYGYGSYGASIETHFSPSRLSLLDRGFVFAIAHVRGGGEMGRPWYDRGKLLNKRNTFTDFITCAQFLVDKGYTSAGRIVCAGGSAGGMLIGAAVNMKPQLWGGAVANVPFVDVINTMLDDTIPLTVIEYEEWGDPHDKKYYEYMRSYSPYDNVRERDYPPMLVTAGLNDPRVQFWEPAKWVARLRDNNRSGSEIILRTRMGEGHTGASGRYDYLREIAIEHAFVLRCVGITH